MKLQDVPYQNLFEEFVRCVAEHPEKNRLREGVVIMQVAEEFYAEYKRRSRALRHKSVGLKK